MKRSRAVSPKWVTPAAQTVQSGSQNEQLFSAAGSAPTYGEGLVPNG
jgi:hypothetical protein